MLSELHFTRLPCRQEGLVVEEEVVLEVKRFNKDLELCFPDNLPLLFDELYRLEPPKFSGIFISEVIDEATFNP